MAELTKLARPYARAIFAYAAEHKHIAEYSEALRNVAVIIAQPEVMKLLKDPRYTIHQLAVACMDLTDKFLNPALRNLIKLLAENHRLYLLPEISHLFERYRSIADRKITAEVYTAIPLTSEYQKELEKVLGARFNDKIVLDCKTEPELLGGLIVKVGDKVFDGSIRGQFERLRETLAD